MARCVRHALLALLAMAATGEELELGGGGVESYPVEGRIAMRGLSDGDGGAPPTTEVVLNGGEYRTYTRPDGAFVFHDVKPGVYLLDVLSVEYIFSQVKLNLPAAAAEGTIRCLEYKYPGAAKQPIGYPLELKPHVRQQYFEIREQPGLHTILRNPMMLMVAFTGFVVLFMPKMMDSMDPEEKKKMQEQMGNAQDPAAMMKSLFGMGGDDDDDEPAEKPRPKISNRK